MLDILNDFEYLRVRGIVRLIKHLALNKAEMTRSILTPDIRHEISEALWGCIEIPLFLKKGATRFGGTIGSFKRSCLVPALIIPLIVMIMPGPAPEATDRTSLAMMSLGTFLSTSVFLLAMYFLKSRSVTNTQFLKFATGYNWLSVSGFVTQLPFILLVTLNFDVSYNVSIMMLLEILYTYAYLIYMICRILKMDWYSAFAFAVMEFLIGRIMYNIAEYLITNL